MNLSKHNYEKKQPAIINQVTLKMAIECPAKLFYTSKEFIYANQKKDDPFLKALAQGGFQVEELVFYLIQQIGFALKSPNYSVRHWTIDNHMSLFLNF